MQRLLAFLLSTLFILNAFSQQLPAMQAPLASKSLMLDIIKINDKQLVAVGERGHILLSNDAITWRQANVPVRTTLTAVYFVDESHGWAVGHDATILFSQDGGENWVIQQFLPEKEKPLIIGNTYRFHSHNYQHNCLRHKDYRMWAEDENRNGDKD